MDIRKIKEAAFHASMHHPGKEFYVVMALKGDVPVNENGYLVMVNELGDRVARCYPGCEWMVDEHLFLSYNPSMPTYKNAVYAGGPKLENK